MCWFSLSVIYSCSSPYCDYTAFYKVSRVACSPLYLLYPWNYVGLGHEVFSKCVYGVTRGPRPLMQERTERVLFLYFCNMLVHAWLVIDWFSFLKIYILCLSSLFSLSPEMITRRVLATPAHGGPRQTKALMYLSFQAWGCWLRKYKVYMLPMLWAMSTTGPPAFSAISSIIFWSFRKYPLFSSGRTTEEMSLNYSGTFVRFSTCLHLDLDRKAPAAAEWTFCLYPPILYGSSLKIH